MSEIVLENVTKRYGDIVAVEGVDLEIRSGELFVLVGPSGCGKTTLLRIIAGLERPTGGDVYLDGERMTGLPARKRDVAVVFQDYALFPHLTVRENVSFNLRMRGYDDVAGRVERVADRLGVADLLGRRVDELSGGQKQRVALGRAIVSEPRAFLLDEPFANLDADLREAMRAELARLQDDLGVTTVHVTHDQREALSLGDRVGVLRDGTLQQVGTPEAVYHRPERLFVATFVGAPTMNLLEGRYEASAGAVRVGADGDGADLVAVPTDARPRDGARLTVGVRPEYVHVDGAARDDAGAAAADGSTPATVSFVEFQGADRFVHLVTEGGRELVARVDGTADVAAGQSVSVTASPARAHLFDGDSGLRLDGSPEAPAADGDGPDDGNGRDDASGRDEEGGRDDGDDRGDGRGDGPLDP